MGSVAALDDDAADTIDRPAETRADRGPHGVGVFLVAVDLPRPPVGGVRLEERLKDGRSILEDGQFLEDLRVDLVQQLLLRGQHDFLALQLGAREGLDPQAFRGLPGVPLSDLEELRSFAPGTLQDPIALRERGGADLLYLGASSPEDVLDDRFEPHADRCRPL